MFKKSKNNEQGNLFSSVSNNFSKRKLSVLEDYNSWHNVFNRELTSRIDEGVFSELYSKQYGRPNASIRVLIGMLVLKDGYGWSDAELYDNCRFNVLVMRSLGLMNFNDDVPSESTYYEFKRLLLLEFKKGNDLMKACFQHVTAQQISTHGVQGAKIRLDSKLINSNIRLVGRLGLILEGIKLFIKQENLDKLKDLFEKDEIELLDKLKSHSTDNITYPLKKKEKELMLTKLGKIMKVLLTNCPEKTTKKYALLEQLYNQHYEENKDNNDNEPPSLKDRKKLSSADIQSVHDPEARYRKKQGQSTKGFHGNVVETCDSENEINLIVDVHTAGANVSEADFLCTAVEQSEQVLKNGGAKRGKSGRTVEHVTTDGGYHSKNNIEAMSKPDQPHWNLVKFKGSKLRYTMSWEQGKLKVFDKQLNEWCEVDYSPDRKNQFKITHPDATRRFMSQDQLDNYFRIQNLKANQNPEDRNLRPNVEATIHQMFHKLLKRNKIKYRGLGQCHNYVLCRAMWVNFKRITKNCLQKAAFLIILMLSDLNRRLASSKEQINMNLNFIIET